MGTILTGDTSRQTEPTEQHEFYPVDVAMRPVFEERSAALADLGVSAAERAKLQDTVVDVIRAVGIDPVSVGRPLYNGAVDAVIASAHGEAEPDVQALAEASRRELRETYGAADAEDLLARTAAFVKQHPKLEATLGMRGLGSRPEIVRALVEHVRAVNFR